MWLCVVVHDEARAVYGGIVAASSSLLLLLLSYKPFVVLQVRALLLNIFRTICGCSAALVAL